MNIEKISDSLCKALLICVLAATYIPLCRATDNLQCRIESILQGKRMTVGVYADWSSGTFGLNEDGHFPMMSVFKVHLALAAINKFDSEREGWDPDSIIHVERRRIRENMYSPMREDYPSDDIDISVRRLIDYAISQSDNNASDILISLAGGVKKIDRYIRSLGIRDFKIKETEASMHKDVHRVYNNWTTPRAMTSLLKFIMNEPNTPLHTDVLLDAMENTSTGKDKMRAVVPDSLMLWNKTGSSDRINGIKTADNDCGIIYMPDGGLCFISVFINESAESDATNASVIAEITRAVIEESNCDGRIK